MAQAHELLAADGSLIPGYLIGAHRESIIVVHEIHGVDAHMREVATRYAAEGFTAFAIDLFDGHVTDDDSRGYQLAAHLDWKAAIGGVRRAQRALARLSGGAKVGIAGFSMGGAVALIAASMIPELAACVTFYGIPTPGKGNLPQIQCKVQGHFGNYDMQNSRDRVDAFEARLASAGIGVEIHRYHTGHFFFDQTRKPPIFSPHNSEHAFRRSVAFFKRELAADSQPA